MSSKHRRLRPRSGYQRPYGSPPVSATTTGGHSDRGKLFFGVVLVLAAGAVVYALTRPKPGTPASAAAAKATPAQAANSAPAKGPRVDCNRTYDFGRAPGDSAVDCQFVLTNTGTAMLEVSQVAPGCGCMKAGTWTRQIPPGQTGSIPVRLDTHHYTGNFAKSVFVDCNDPAQPKLILEIKGYVFRPLEFKPPLTTMVLNLNSETPSNQASVQLLNHLEEPLAIYNPQCTLANVQVEIVTNQPGKDYQLIARTVPPLPTASQAGQLTLSTSLTNQPVTNLNVFVNYQAAVLATPYQLFLPAGPLTSSVPLTAWARNNGTNSLVVTQASVNVPGVAIEQHDDPVNRGIAVTATFPAGFQAPAGTNLELTIQTTHPLHPVLKVPIHTQAPAPTAARP